MASEDNTHLLAIFDAPIPETIFGSDILKLTPSNILAYTYRLNEAKVKDTLAPIQNTVVIGPPKNCDLRHVKGKMQQQYQNTTYAYPHQGYNATYGEKSYISELPPQETF